MLKIHGKYNVANVMIDEIDQTTRHQIQTFVDNEVFKDGNIVIMPDCHAGNGACIGFTAKYFDKLIPNVIGVDIGCGMYATKFSVSSMDFSDFDNYLRRNIPFGFSAHEKPHSLVSYIKNLDKYVALAKKVGQKEGKVLESLSTLGGGNHFCEIDLAPDGNYILVIHSGSRNLGLSVANYHQEIAKSKMTSGFVKDLEYLKGDDANNYITDMSICQDYAFYNRKIMMSILLDFFKKDPTYKEFESFECVHNYISLSDNTIRKGAISAHKGEKVIIPLNMKDGIIFGTGKGNEYWNCSAPHGAGRLMSRSQAKRELDLDEFSDGMKGVWSSCIGKDTLDEAPNAYKPMKLIVDAIADTVDIDFIAKPIYNFKDDSKVNKKDKPKTWDCGCGSTYSTGIAACKKCRSKRIDN